MRSSVWVFASVLFVGCPGSANNGSSAPNDSAAPVIESAPTTQATASSSVLPPTGTCAPWEPSPRSVIAFTTGGRGDFFRELRYDFQTGEVRVHDSDPFADGSGKEAVKPRVIEKKKVLTGDDRDKTEKALLAICPDEAAMKAACAPGGCSRLTVTRGDGTETKIEHNDTVVAALDILRPFFPELRTK